MIKNSTGKLYLPIFRSLCSEAGPRRCFVKKSVLKKFIISYRKIPMMK